MKIKVSYQPASEYELLHDRLLEYEAIYGTATYTGNKDRDEEYKNLKQRVAELLRASK